MSLTGGASQNESVVEVVESQATKNANIYHARTVLIEKKPNDPLSIEVIVTWERGWNDTEGNFHAVQRSTTSLNAAQIGPYLLQQVVAGQTIEKDFKDKLWAALQEHANLPTGVVA